MDIYCARHPEQRLVEGFPLRTEKKPGKMFVICCWKCWMEAFDKGMKGYTADTSKDND